MEHLCAKGAPRWRASNAATMPLSVELQVQVTGIVVRPAGDEDGRTLCQLVLQGEYVSGFACALGRRDLIETVEQETPFTRQPNAITATRQRPQTQSRQQAVFQSAMSLTRASLWRDLGRRRWRALGS